MARKKSNVRQHSRNVKHGGMNIDNTEPQDEDDFFEGEQEDRDAAYQDAYNNDNVKSNTNPSMTQGSTEWRETNGRGEGSTVEERHPIEISDTDYDWERQDIQNLKRR